MNKYPKHYRIRYDHISVAYGKRYLEDPRPLFRQKDLVLLEKLDGSQVGVGFKNGVPYLQGRNSHIPLGDKRKAYAKIWSWAWKNLEKIQQLQGYLLYGEFLRVQHNLPYDDLSDWVVFFDVYDMKKKRFIDTMVALDFIRDIGFEPCPVIYEGRVKYDELPGLVEQRKPAFLTHTELAKTRFTSTERAVIQAHDRFPDGRVYMEGCVVKPRASLKFAPVKSSVYWSNCAKFVSNEFLDCFSPDSHWTSERVRENKLSAWFLHDNHSNL